MKKRIVTKFLAIALAVSMAFPAVSFSSTVAYADGEVSVEEEVVSSSSERITYSFSGSQFEKAGYAQGTIQLSVDTAGTYNLYWANDNEALDGYYPIGTLDLKANASGTVSLGYHTVIPAGATKIIATTGSLSVSDAYAVYDIPVNKQFSSGSGEKLYSFSTYSDIHIDTGSDVWYKNAEKNLEQALKYSTQMGTDYIVVSGDCITNDYDTTIDKEWKAYSRVLSKSDYVNPIWESDGNHEMRQGVSAGLSAFRQWSGTDGSNNGKSYFSMVEPKTGDLFIFMALEKEHPHTEEEFSSDQIAWVRDLLVHNYENRNVFIVEHAPIEGYGAGDRMSQPYYGGMLSLDNDATKAFKQILNDYPNVVFLSGHTHEDYVMDYNYFDDGGDAAHMIHTPSLAGSTMPDEKDKELLRNEGKGFNSQGYYVEVYQNEIVFYGANITDEKIYPAYSYIMEGSRTDTSPIINSTVNLEYSGEMVDATGELSMVAAVLTKYYRYASFDSYQSLKKLYYEFKDCTTVKQGVIDEFQARIEALSNYTGEITVYPLRSKYYFVNDNNWSSVYAYAWTGSDHNAEWPGVKINKVGTNSSGKDVYCVNFASAGEYENLIFDSGSGGSQTVDIFLPDYAYNCFTLNGLDNGKYKVENSNYDNGDEPDPPIVVTGDKIALLYYVSDEHDWSNIDTFFTKGNDGKYRLKYNATGDKTFSFSLYNKTTGKYYTLSASQRIDFSQGESFNVTLKEESARGKSVSIYGLSDADYVDLEFDPSNKNISIKCSGGEEPILTGWQNIDDQWYYYNMDGTIRTGWLKSGNKWYYLNADGVMQTGWVQTDGKQYYMDSNGAMQTGWKKIDGKWYYFVGNGAMAKDWNKIDDKWYYFESDGIMATGWKKINDKEYFFKNSGVMAASEWCNGYWLNSDGTWTYPYKASWKQDSKGWWYGDKSGWYAKNTVIQIDSKSYTFDEKGYIK